MLSSLFENNRSQEFKPVHRVLKWFISQITSVYFRVILLVAMATGMFP